MDSNERTKLEVHRCRFVDWSPGEITALAFSPLAPPNSLYSVPGTSKPASANDSPYGVLAVGRGNGSIEMCEWSRPETDGIAYQGWTVRRVLSGPNSSKVDSLAFAFRDPFVHRPGTSPGLAHLRLFSTTGGKDLVEWDLDLGTVKRVVDSEAGAIWSISLNPTSTTLALGCDEGIRLFSLISDEFTPSRRLDRIKARILSLTWAPQQYVPKEQKNSSSDSEDDDDEDSEKRWQDTFILAGCSDSSVRKWDVKTGRVVERMTTDQVRGEKTLVWAVGVLLDGTVVTGDSLGCVKFWDPLTSTQIISFQAHEADVLCLAIGPDQKSVYASGVDQRVSEFSLVTVSSSNHYPSAYTPASSSSQRWIHTRSKRLHVHDVRAIAIWPPPQLFPSKYLPRNIQTSLRSRTAPVIVTGGSDLTLTLTAVAPPASRNSNSNVLAYNPLAKGPAQSLEDAFVRRQGFAQLGASGGRIVSVAKNARFVLCRKEASISIWYVPVQKNPVHPLMMNVENVLDEKKRTGGEMKEETVWRKMLEMDLKVDTNISCCAISDDGCWVAVGDAYETKLFRLVPEPVKGFVQLHPRRIKTLTSTLQSHLSSSSSSSTTISTASSSLQFTPDSTKLILAINSLVIIVELVIGRTGDDEFDKGTKVKETYDAIILRSFSHHRSSSLHSGSSSGPSGVGRTIKSLPNGTGEKGEDEDVHMNEDDSDESAVEVDDILPSTNGKSDGKSWPIISHICISSDCQWLATSDLAGRTHVFNVDAVKHHCTLPTSPLPPTSISFNSAHTSSTHILVLLFPNNTIQVYDVEARNYPSWAREINQRLPYALERLPDPVAGIVFLPSENEEDGDGDVDIEGSVSATSTARRSTTSSTLVDRQQRLNPPAPKRNVILWGRGWLCKVDLMGSGIMSGDAGPGFRKRSRSFGSNQAPTPIVRLQDTQRDESSQVVTRYRDIMLVDLLGPRELIVVERPAVEILQSLRPAYYKPKYGAK